MMKGSKRRPAHKNPIRNCKSFWVIVKSISWATQVSFADI